jgi:hypothetical protein
MRDLHKWASKIAKKEGKKSQARIGDIREILKILVDLEADTIGMEMGKAIRNSPSWFLLRAGAKARSKRRK